MTKGVRRGWFRRARQTSKPTDQTEVARLWTAHLRAHQSANHAVELTTQLLASTKRQQVLLDGALDLIRQAANRSPEIQDPIDQVAHNLDRLRLIALNVGLEGARLGDPAGHTLMNMADEVRSLTERANEAVQELRTALDDTLSLWNQAVHRTEETRHAHEALETQFGSLQTAADNTLQDIQPIGTHTRSLLDMDPHTAVALARVTEHAKELIQALGSLGDHARQDIIRSALGPTLHPLLRALLQIANPSKIKPLRE
jgi:methyl-accepting chemotaxis protein